MLHYTSCLVLFFFNDTATTEIYTLSLHDALPISHLVIKRGDTLHVTGTEAAVEKLASVVGRVIHPTDESDFRSEEHTSELQSHLNLVCRLLLEKKKKPHPDNATPRSTPTAPSQSY